MSELEPDQRGAALQVRLARREDCEAIAAVHVTSWQAGYAGLFTAAYLASLSVAERAESWLGILEGSASSTFVATAAGVVVGFVTFAHCRDRDATRERGEVWALYVSPARWSTGTGQALWEAARVRMLHHGYSEVSLWVLARNARGRRFYGALGFEPEQHSEQSFERGGTQLQEVRLRFSRMSAWPCIEQAARLAGGGVKR